MKKILQFLIAIMFAVSPVISVGTTNNISTVNAAKVKKHSHVKHRKHKSRKHKKHRRKKVTFASKRAATLKEYQDGLKPYRTIKINVPESDPYYKDIIAGINAWNDTGVFIPLK